MITVMILTKPSALRWNIPYAAVASARAADEYAERVIFGQERDDVGDPALHIGLTHPELICLSNNDIIGIGSAIPP